MTFNLRTTICINMLILLVAAIGLISVIVFRVSEQEIRLQQQHAADQVFISVAATLSTWLTDTSVLTPEDINMNAYLSLLADRMDCDTIVFTDRNGQVRARAGGIPRLPWRDLPATGPRLDRRCRQGSSYPGGGSRTGSRSACRSSPWRERLP